MKMLVGLLALVALPLVDSLRESAEPTQSGAGSKIAFTKLREDVEIPGSTEQLEAEIWVMNGDGSDPRRLTYNTTDDLGAVWSPNGKTVAFYGIQFGPGPGGDLVQIGPPHVYLTEADGGEQTVLTVGRFPNWSPNGHKIAFDSGGQGSNIFVINADGTDLEQLTKAAGRNIRPDWSPDGQRIAFAKGPIGNEEIYVMNADGSGPIQLTHNDVGDNAPSWSPNGQAIAFQSDRDGNAEIYVMSADGTGQTRLTNYHGRDLDADWSPDGRMIAFQRDIEPIEDQILQVFVMNADGTGLRPLTALPSENGHPGWGRGRAVKP